MMEGGNIGAESIVHGSMGKRELEVGGAAFDRLRP
jgi:hypothetical protein